MHQANLFPVADDPSPVRFSDDLAISSYTSSGARGGVAADLPGFHRCRPHRTVSGCPPDSVTRTVCSACAAREPSTVTTAQPSRLCL